MLGRRQRRIRKGTYKSTKEGRVQSGSDEVQTITTKERNCKERSVKKETVRYKKHERKGETDTIRA